MGKSQRIAVLGLLAAAVAAVPRAARGPIEWTAYAGDAGGSKYSPADQITAGNVGSLTPAWTYRTGDYGVGAAQARDETTPILRRRPALHLHAVRRGARGRRRDHVGGK
jgi:glucose dehydrogenase